MERVRAVATAVVGVVVIVAAIVYAVRPSPAPPGAGQIVGYSSPAPVSSVLWIGDTYDAEPSTGAIVSAASLICQQLPWSCAYDVQAGTGFLAQTATASGEASPAAVVASAAPDTPTPTGVPLIDRLPYDVANVPSPSVIVLDAGRADTARDPDLAAAVQAYLSALATAYPHARVVVIAPFELTGATTFGAARSALSAGAAAHHWSYVDPRANGWAPVTDSQQAASLVTPGAGSMPTDAGSAYIASHLKPDLVQAVAASTAAPSAASAPASSPRPSTAATGTTSATVTTAGGDGTVTVPDATRTARRTASTSTTSSAPGHGSGPTSRPPATQPVTSPAPASGTPTTSSGGDTGSPTG